MAAGVAKCQPKLHCEKSTHTTTATIHTILMRVSEQKQQNQSGGNVEDATTTFTVAAAAER